MAYPPLWLWLLAIALTLVGLLLTRFPSIDRLIARLPLWLCLLLVLAALVGMWFLLNAQFGGLAVHLLFP